VLQNQQTALQDKIKLYQELSGKLAALKSASTKLSTTTNFFVKAATSSKEDVLLATASSSADAANHSVTVGSLARSSTLASIPFSDTNTTVVGTGTLALTVGTTTTNIAIDGTNNTLEGLRDAINDSDAGVTATIVTVTAGTTPSYRLVINGKNTGLSNAVTLSEAGLTGGTAPGFATTQAAVDAALIVDGIPVARAANVVSDVISGVTLDLKSASAAEAQVTVSDDTDAIQKQLNEFVTAYNDVTSFIAEKTKYDSATKTGGPLIGDATLASLKRSLQSLITTPVAGSFSILGEIGIATQKNGTLSIDNVKFDAALKSDLAGVGNLFAATTDGLAKSVINFADNATRLGDGVLSVRIDGAQGEIDKIADRIARKEDSINRLADELTRKFTALETLVSQLNTQGNYLTQQLLGLSSQLNK
jgi:flagellar hook-associated protein 2